MDTRAGMTQASVRSANLALVLGRILRRSGIVSRADIAAELGMTRSTVSRLVDDLISGELVEELDTVAGSRGRPAVPLALRPHTVQALGLEINVERIVATVVGLTGELLAVANEDVDVTSLTPPNVLTRLASLAERAWTLAPDGGRLAGAMLAFPGLVDRAGQVLLRAPNLDGWEGLVPSQHWRLTIDGSPVGLRVVNDIDSSARTVLRDAPGSSFIYVTGEVGIGSAIAIDGQLMTGRHGWASELGHVCVEPGGELCGCGADGCLETVAGSRGILRLAGLRTLDELLSALAGREPRALAAVGRVAEALGMAVGGALNLLDVTSVNLGGHLGLLAPWLEDRLREELSRRVLWAGYSEIEISVVDEAPLRAAMGAGIAVLGSPLQDPAAWIGPLLSR